MTRTATISQFDAQQLWDSWRKDVVPFVDGWDAGSAAVFDEMLRTVCRAAGVDVDQFAKHFTFKV
jgi:hypothetical protein